MASGQHSLRIRIGVQMETSAGLKVMAGPAYDTDQTGDPALLYIESASMGLLSYPDQRAARFYIYATDVLDDVEQGWYVREYPALKALHNEMAYALYGAFDGSKYGISWANFIALASPVATATVAAIPVTLTDGDLNLVLVSETYQPRMIFARSALTVGNDAEDEVLAFQANALPISDGQFGDFPVIAFCRRSITALRSGTDVAFSSVSPVSVQRGIVGREAVANIGGQTFYMAHDGLFRLGERDPLSAPIQNSTHPHDLLANADASTALAHFVDASTGRREVWVSTPARTYCYSLEYKRWFTSSVTRRSYLMAYGRLWGVGANGVLNEAGSAAGTFQRGLVTLAPLHLASPEILKRWRKVIVRYQGDLTVPFTQVTDYDLTIQLAGVTGLLLSVDVVVEPRYGHRVPIQRSSRIMVSTAGDAAAIQASTIADLSARSASLEAEFALFETNTNNQLAIINDHIMRANVSPSGREVGVPMAGRSVEFGLPFSSMDSYMPTVFGFSADMTRQVTVGVTLTATGMTFTPAEDDTIIYWKAESL